MKRHLRKVVIAMLIGVAIYGLFVLYAGYAKIGESLGHFHYSAFFAALLLSSFNYGLRFLKWEYYLARLEVRGVPKLESLLVFLSGFVLTVTPGKVGEVFKSAVLAETHGVPAVRTAPIIVAERLTDVIAVIALIVAGSSAFHGGLPWAIAGTIAVGFGLTLILWRTPALALFGWLERPGGRLTSFAPKLREGYEGLRIVATPSALLWPTFLSIVGWGSEGYALFLLLRGFGCPVEPTLAIFFYSTATLAGAIVPVPGGLGVAEALIQEQLVHLGGVAEGPATASMILIRFATLWWAVVVGFAALALLRMRFPALLRDVAEAVD
jgi:glycosyltransferase 2 family protein